MAQLESKSGNWKDYHEFNSIIKKYSNAVYGVAYNILGDYYTAEDIAQEVFIIAYSKAFTLRNEDKLGSWLYSITKRTALNYIRKKRDIPVEDMMLDNTAVDDFSETLVNKENEIIIKKALNQLPKGVKEAIILFYIGGYTAREIAEFSDVPVKTIESRIHRAKINLRKELLPMVSENLQQNRLSEDFEKSMEESIRKIYSYTAIGKIDTAIEKTRKLLLQNPENDLLRNQLSDFLFMKYCNTDDMQLLDESENELRKVKDKNERYYHHLGLIYQSKDKRAEAEKYFLKGGNFGKLQLSRMYNERGEEDKAEELLQNLAASNLQMLMSSFQSLFSNAKANGNVLKAQKYGNALISIYECFKNGAVFNNTAFDMYLELAALDFQLGKDNQAAENIEKGWKKAKELNNYYGKNIDLTQPELFDKLSVYRVRNAEVDDISIFMDKFTGKTFEAFKDNDVYKKILAKLKN